MDERNLAIKEKAGNITNMFTTTLLGIAIVVFLCMGYVFPAVVLGGQALPAGCTSRGGRSRGRGRAALPPKAAPGGAKAKAAARLWHHVSSLLFGVGPPLRARRVLFIRFSFFNKPNREPGKLW